MPDYSKGKIYKLHILGNDELIYYGSTIQTLSLRMSSHRKDYRKGRFIASYKLFDTDYKNVLITLIENYPCNAKYELEARERFYIENNICVNKNIPTRTIKEYYKEYYNKNKKEILKKNKEWEQNNKEYMKEYRIINKDKLMKQRKEYYENNKEKIKEYNINNKDKIKERRKDYYKNNKEKYKEYNENNKEKAKEKIECSYCKSVIRKDTLKRHNKTLKCKKFQNNI